MNQFKPILTPRQHRRNLTLAQEGRELVLQLRTPDSSDKGRAFVVRNLFPAPDWTDVVVTVSSLDASASPSTASGSTASCRRRRSRAGIPPRRPDPGQREPGGNRPWIGALRRAEGARARRAC